MNLIWSVALNGSENWTLRKNKKDRLKPLKFGKLQYRKYQLEGSHDKRICVRPRKRKKEKATKKIRNSICIYL